MPQQTPRVHVDAPAAKLRRLRELQSAWAAQEHDDIGRRRRELLEKCPHPLALAMYFDDTVVSVPAMEYVSKSLVETLHTDNGRLTLSLPSQVGKAIDVNEPVLTTEGWSTMGALRVGDYVFHPDGHPVRVAEVHPVRENRSCYRVTTVDGRSLVVDGEHLWTVQDRRVDKSKVVDGKRVRSFPWVTVTTDELLRRGVHRPSRKRPDGTYFTAPAFRLPDQDTVVSKPVDLPLDPYLFGAWLGDGTGTVAAITVGDQDYAEMRQLLLDTGVRFVSEVRTRTAWHLRLTISTSHQECRTDGVGARLRSLGVWGNKHIPEQYLTAGTEQRLALLQGLLDTDGSITHTGSSSRVEFTSCSERLARDTLYLIRSLGWRASMIEAPSTLYGREVGRRWRIGFVPQQGQMVPFRLRRKADKVQAPQSRAGEARALSIASIEPVESRPVRCIRVDREDGLFLAGRDLVPTHNTFTTRWFILWALLDNPNRRCIFASYSMVLARTSGRYVRDYVVQYGAPYGLELDESHHDAADWQLKGYAGGLLSATPDSTLTGRPSDCMILDDLHAGEAEANSTTMRDRVAVWWESTARTRMAPGTPAIAIGTRFSYRDILSKFIKEGWQRVNIPALADGNEALDSVADVPGARTDDGYLITTRGHRPDDWRGLREEMGERAWSALAIGNPVPVQGGVYMTAWFDAHRRDELDQSPTLTAVFVDPAETGLGDAAGILVAARLPDAKVAVLADYTEKLSAARWGRKVCLAWMEWNASRVVQERTLGLASTIPDAWSILHRQATALANASGSLHEEAQVNRAVKVLFNAGDTVAANKDQITELVPHYQAVLDHGPNGPRVVTVTPKMSKRARAESVASAWETGRAFLVGSFPEMEWEAVTWAGPPAPSPNRLDTMVMATAYLEQAGGRATMARTPRHLQAVPTSTVMPLAR